MATYDIKRTNGSVEWLVKTVKPSGSQTREAMGVDVVDMAFTLPVFTEFRIGDFVTVYGRKYKLNVSPTVERKAKRHFDYTIQFEAEWYDLAKVQLQFLNPQNLLLEPVFSLMGNASTIVGLIVENANRHSSGWTVGVVDETDYRNFTFNAQNCLQALHELAGTFQTEFWIDGKTIHLQKREQASGVTFEYGKGNGLYNIRRSNKSSANILTRLYVRGGSTNLPSGYGSNSLLLPGGATYIQDAGKVDMYGLIEATQIFPDIFPKREGTVTGVVAGAGNWMYFTDSVMDFDVNAQKAPGLDAKVTFNTGQLAGYTFTISNYNPVTKQFTINKNTDEAALDVPSDLLRPAVGDKYVIIDIIMPASYVTEAENKLQAAGQAYYDKNSDPLFLLEYSATCDPLFIKQNAVDVQLGNTAVLYDTEMGLNVELRIAKYVRDLQEADKYNDVVWSDTIGANEIVRQYQQQQKMLLLLESSGLLDINQLRKNLFLNRLSEQDGYLMLSGNKVKSGLADLATDALHADIADYALNADLWDGRDFADYLDQPVRTTDDVRFKSITSTSFVSGAMGSGWKVDEAGNATFDNLTVRKEFNVYELVLNKISGTNGALAVTDTIKIDTVTETSTGYDCTIDTGNDTVAVPFQVNDLVRCQVWNGSAVKYYFAKVTAVGNGTFTLDKATKDGAGVPAAGDTVVRFGNTTNANRQGLLYLTASDDGAPYLDVLDGVTSSDLSGKTKVRLGKLSGIADPDFGALAGYGLYGENVYLKNGHFKGVVEVTGGNAETTSGAQGKADTAQAAAILAAANDATNKVNAVEVGGRNYISGSGFTTAVTKDIEYLIDNSFSGKEVTLSFDYEIVNADGVGNARIGLEPMIYYSDGSSQYVAAWIYAPLGFSGKGRFSITYLLENKPIVSIGQNALYVQVGGDTVKAGYPKLEKGNKPTDWTPAPEDVAADISAADTKAQNAQNAHNSLVASLRSLAYQDVVELADMGTTVIEGGKIKTVLLDAAWIQSNVVKADYINTLQLDASAIKTGIIDAARLNASAIVVAGGGATQGYVDTAVDNIQVGGRNLVVNSALERSNPSTSGAYAIVFDSGLIHLDAGDHRLQMLMKINSSAQADNLKLYFYGELRNGLQYSEYYSETVCDYSGVYKKYTASITVTAAGDIQVYALVGNPNSVLMPAGIAFVKYIKLEKGNQPTDWTPNPDDYGAMAYEDIVELSKLGTTVIENGKIKTTLLDAEYIKSNIVNAAYIQALDIVATNVAADTGTIGGWILSSEYLNSYENGYANVPKMRLHSSGEIAMQGETLGEASYLRANGLTMYAGNGTYQTNLGTSVAGVFRVNGESLQVYESMKTALYAYVNGGYGYAAQLMGLVRLGGGQVLKPKLLTTGVNYYCTSEDYYVVASHGLNIYLPANPVEGRTLIIGRATSTGSILFGNGKNIYVRSDSPVTNRSLGWNEMYMFVNNGWRLIFNL